MIAEARRLGLGIEIRHLPEGTRTAGDAARACGCSVAQIVKSIVMRDVRSDRHVLFLTAGDRRVDPARAGDLAGCDLEKADPVGIRRITGFAIGGVSPIGHLKPIETFFDPGLLSHAVIWAAAGTPNDVFAIAPDALVAALDPKVAEFSS